MALKLNLIFDFSRMLSIVRHMSSSISGEWGTGAGKGGGTGGAVREAGGSFGKMEAAREEQYFRKLQQKQLNELKIHLDEEIEHHKKIIQQHQQEIERHKKRIEELDNHGRQED